MKKYGLVLFIMVIIITIKAQTCIERAEQAGFKRFLIPDNIYNVDSIEFLMSYPINPTNPSIIFLQGSGNYTLISYDVNENYSFATIPPYDIQVYVQKYNFISISKPGTPLCSEWRSNRPFLDTTYSNYVTFLKMDFLDYYVAQTNQVIAFMKNILHIKTPIYLIGNSQGGKVAAKYSFLYPNNVQKLIFYSVGIFDRYLQEIYDWRLKADKGKISIEDAFAQINTVYKRYENLKNWVEENEEIFKQENTTLSDNTYSAISNYSYNFDIPINYLLKIDIPILAVYGTNDIKTRDNDMLPLFFTRAGKNNLSMLPVFGCDHFFVKNTLDLETGKIIESKYMGDEVFEEIEKWISNEK